MLFLLSTIFIYSVTQRYTPLYWQGNEKRLYEFVVRHFLACCSEVGNFTLCFAKDTLILPEVVNGEPYHKLN